MFLEEWQFFEAPFLEPLKGFKDVSFDDSEADFFNFEDPAHIQTHSNDNSVNGNYDGVNCNGNNGIMEDWWQLPTPDSESGSGYAPLSDSAAGSQATPVDFSVRGSVSEALETAPFPTSSSVSSLVTWEEQLLGQDQEPEKEEAHLRRVSTLTSTPRYVKQPRQNRYSGSSPPKGRRVSDSRLSAQGLAEVLRLDSPDEALKRERFILDIFETELHYPLGYKTWVRDTSKDYRLKLIDQLYDRVKGTYPEYDRNVLETIIRRATYYIMQSRLRRERRARAKSRRERSSSN